MEPNEIEKFIHVHEKGKKGDYREFELLCPYVENGRGSRFSDSLRVSGTEETTIGEAGIGEKIRRKVAAFSKYLANYARQNHKYFEVRGKQLWLCKQEDTE